VRSEAGGAAIWSLRGCIDIAVTMRHIATLHSRASRANDWVVQCSRAIPSLSHENPFASSLNKLVEHHADIRQHKAADVESKELAGVPCAQIESDMGGRRVLEARVLDLTSDLIC
jgi:hypothetical protein